MACCDTSFLCALYVLQVNSVRANAWYQASETSLVVTDLVLLEFRQSIRLQSWLHAQDRTKGFAGHLGQRAINSLASHLAEGRLVQTGYDWTSVAGLTERLSAQHTARFGCRIFDILLVAVSLSLGEREFLTFDSRQRLLAEAEGLTVPL